MANHLKLQIQYGTQESALETSEAGIHVSVAAPHLSGPTLETLWDAPGELTTQDGFSILCSGKRRSGVGIFPFSGDLTDVARQAYRALFLALEGHHLYRVWHFVPGINAHVNGMEVYRLFCKGRAMAFEEIFQKQATSHMCAASAVGSGGSHLVVIFSAGAEVPGHLENPQQTPAYEYPSDYGPRPPCFSRASIVGGDPVSHFYLAGTASIKGHQSLWPDDTEQQTRTTLENMAILFEKAGVHPETVGPETAGKVYLRNPGDTAMVLKALEKEFPFLKDHLICLQADICRSELDVEIEATLPLHGPDFAPIVEHLKSGRDLVPRKSRVFSEACQQPAISTAAVP